MKKTIEAYNAIQNVIIRTTNSMNCSVVHLLIRNNTYFRVCGVIVIKKTIPVL